MIDVDAPTLAYAGVPGIAALEFPLEVLIGPVKSMGAVAGPESMNVFQYVVYRRLSSGSDLDVWDESSKAWYPQGTHSTTSAQLAYLPDEPYPWKGMIVAAGGKDATGQPQYAKAAGGYPLYHVRALFETKDPEEIVLSGPSANVAFAGSSDKNLMVMGPGDDEKPEDATEARLLLRNTSLNEIGGLHIVRDSPGARVTLANAAGASIVLHADGHIELAPAPGKNVLIVGDLEAEKITYSPGGVGAKKVLP
jgi:hypothetical protein